MEQSRSYELNGALEDEKNKSARLDASLGVEKERKLEAAKTDKVVAKQLKNALDAVQVSGPRGKKSRMWLCVLYCTMLFCAALYFAVLCCTVLY